MRATMMDIPLTITSIMKYGTTVFGHKQVVTSVGAPGSVRRRTYAEAGQRAARLAGALRDLGVDGDQRVGTFMWNNAEHLEAYLAIPCMGAVLHTLNLRLLPAQTGYIANHAEDYAVIVDGCLVPLFSEILPHVPTVKHVIVSGPGPGSGPEPLPSLPGVAVHSYEELLAASSPSFDWPALDEHSAAAMCYTSGTTGNPKGVVYSHRSTYLHSLAPCHGNTFAISERDRVLPIVPMFHANAWGFPYAAVWSGADLVFTDRFLQPDAVADLIASEQATIGAGVPTIWTGMLAYLRSSGMKLPSLRLAIGGGSALPHTLLETFESEVGAPLVQAWGMTETSPLGSIANPPPDVSPAEGWRYRDGQGRLFGTLEGRLTGDDGAVLPSDGKAVGELEVRGPWVTGSYYRDADPEKFRDGWLRTGDVGTLDSRGYIRLTDRSKDVIKSGGEWISSMELENYLMAHPCVAEAAVIGVADAKWGERPLAAVVLRPGSSASAAELRTFLSSRVAKWQLPERWCFIDEVPKTSVGKFSKVRMREAYQRGDYAVIEAR
jgi:fatty-acyl-CoA synthase